MGLLVYNIPSCCPLGKKIKEPLLKKILKFAFHPDLRVRLAISLIYFLACLVTNFFLLQAFCVPVWWAALFSGICFAAIIFFPLVKNNGLRNVFYFLIGTGVPVSVYCLIFLDFPLAYLFYIPGILFFGAGLLPFFPIYLLYHTWQYFKTGSNFQNKLLITGCLLPLLSFLIYFLTYFSTYTQLEQNLSGLDSFSPAIAVKLPANHLTERVLGVGFKYHTSLDFVFDGWRPPLHDPYFNLFLRLRAGTTYPFPKLHLAYRISYYRQLFPEEPVRLSCGCSFHPDAMTYFGD